ncbi:MAG: hypothetical protein MI922_29660, partial [Bacteroidales bacterium]|nr:hypothetical protein [Bacteroidales bacterium]
MKTYLLKLTLALMVLTALTIKGKAEVHVYNYPNTIVNTNNGKNIKSTQYKVTVKQGSTNKSCYVMYKQNQNTQGNLANNFNDHWTNFSYDGSVQVTVEK